MILYMFVSSVLFFSKIAILTEMIIYLELFYFAAFLLLLQKI